MKSIVLIGALFLTTSAFAAPGPAAYTGWFKLVQTKLGSCDERFEGYYVERTETGGDLRLSAFHFNDINLGQQVFDDELMKITAISYTDEKGAYSKTRMVTKATGETSVTVNRATLKGDVLSLRSRTDMSSPTEPGFGFNTHCVYRRTAPPADAVQP